MFMSLIKTVLPGWGSGILKLFFLPMGQPLLQYGMKKKKNSVQEELVEDMMSLIASFSGQLYGMRSKKNAGGGKFSYFPVAVVDLDTFGRSV